MPMDVCHILLGIPWKYDRKVIHDEKNNCYRLVKDEIKHTLVPMKEEDIAGTSGMKALLVGGKEFLRQIEANEDMLHKFGDIMVDDLLDKFPPKHSISHHIDFIPRASLPKKATYRMSPKDSEEIKKNVQELLDKVLIQESLIPCVVLTILAPKRGGQWQMSTDF
eukprot:PITA_25397